MAEPWLALAAAALWVLFIVVVVIRFLDSKRLDDYPALAPVDAPRLSVIIPARDEARNIEACLRSVLASTYPRLEVIVVDDHSSDGTAQIAQRIANEDSGSHGTTRVLVVPADPLPPEWFGKQWACHSGARAAHGEILCFTDADTRHGPELLARSVNAMRQRQSALFTVAGHQEALSFWEKVVQPFVFVFLLTRYGGVEAMSRSTRPMDKIANGQFLMLTRAAYAAIGGHEAVKDHVAEDLRLAQRVAERGLGAHMVLGRDHLRTRMYTSLAEIRRGWGKNVYAAGRDTLPLGPVTRRLLPLIFPLPALVPVIPIVILALALLGVLGPTALLFGAIVTGANAVFWMGAYAYARLNPLWGLTFPVAALIVSWICAEAAWRGSRVEWKGRDYISRPA
jgi:chlorobactene glucosyltransferase